MKDNVYGYIRTARLLLITYHFNFRKLLNVHIHHVYSMMNIKIFFNIFNLKWLDNSVKISHVYHNMDIRFCKLHLQNYSEWDITIPGSFFSVIIPIRHRCGQASSTKSWLPLCAMYLLWASEIKELTDCAKHSIGRTILIPMMNNWELDASWNTVLQRIRSYCNI